MRASRAKLLLLVLATVLTTSLAPRASVTRSRTAAQARSVAARRMGVHFRSTGPTLRFSARDLAQREVQRKLQSGLPQTILMRIYAYRDGQGEPLAVSARTCRVVYDLWEEVYRLEQQTSNHDRSTTASSLDQVLNRCLIARDYPIGGNHDYHRGDRIYFAVLIEFNPLSPQTVQRIRRWLARPAGGRVDGEAFFGSFVSLFVNRQIGAAERTLRFRSQTVEVP